MSATRQPNRPPPQTAFREPDWRITQAADIVQGILPEPDRPDDVVRQFVDLGRRSFKQPPGLSPEQARRDYPDFVQALRVYRECGEQRRLIEALVLGGASAEEISAATGLPVSTVRFYERAFYDCRDSTRAAGILLSRVVARASQANTLDVADVCWKLVAFAAGPKALAAFREQTRNLDLRRADIRVVLGAMLVFTSVVKPDTQRVVVLVRLLCEALAAAGSTGRGVDRRLACGLDVLRHGQYVGPDTVTTSN